jgi:hypothetical protein
MSYYVLHLYLDFTSQKLEKNHIKHVFSHIPINREVPKFREGWLGKAKGLLQVLWARGFIDTNKLSSYTLTDRKDELGNVDLCFSLRHLMAMCLDFLNKEGMMEHVGLKLANFTAPLDAVLSLGWLYLFKGEDFKG